MDWYGLVYIYIYTYIHTYIHIYSPSHSVRRRRETTHISPQCGHGCRLGNMETGGVTKLWQLPKPTPDPQTRMHCARDRRNHPSLTGHQAAPVKRTNAI